MQKILVFLLTLAVFMPAAAEDYKPKGSAAWFEEVSKQQLLLPEQTTERIKEIGKKVSEEKKSKAQWEQKDEEVMANASDNFDKFLGYVIDGKKRKALNFLEKVNTASFMTTAHRSKKYPEYDRSTPLCAAIKLGPTFENDKEKIKAYLSQKDILTIMAMNTASPQVRCDSEEYAPVSLAAQRGQTQVSEALANKFRFALTDPRAGVLPVDLALENGNYDTAYELAKIEPKSLTANKNKALGILLEQRHDDARAVGLIEHFASLNSDIGKMSINENSYPQDIIYRDMQGVYYDRRAYAADSQILNALRLPPYNQQETDQQNSENWQQGNYRDNNPPSLQDNKTTAYEYNEAMKRRGGAY
jgi:hypothetical protein